MGSAVIAETWRGGELMQHSSEQTYTLWQIESWARKTGQISEARAAARHRRRRYPRGGPKQEAAT
jgi:hypothetical protein